MRGILDLIKSFLNLLKFSYVNRTFQDKEEPLDISEYFYEKTIWTNVVTKLRAAGCVFAEEETRMLISAAQTSEELASMVDKRVAGMPLEHIIGWVEFCGRRIMVDPDVFVPRRRTEFLVRQAINIVQPGSVVIDLCCGSGAIGVVLAGAQEDIELYSTDIDPKAVSCAIRNINEVGGHVYVGDLFTPLPSILRGRVDVIIANVPYVPTERIKLLPQEARLHEARVALDGGIDGLDVQRKVAIEAPRWLTSGGHLIIETSERQVAYTAEIFKVNGLTTQVARCDELDATVVIGIKNEVRK